MPTNTDKPVLFVSAIPDTLCSLRSLCRCALKAKILLVDDHDVVRKGIRAHLDGRCEVCAEAINGKEAIEKAVELKPDLISDGYFHAAHERAGGHPPDSQAQNPHENRGSLYARNAASC